MLASDIPYKFAEIWAAAAAGGYVTDPIPGTATGADASQHLGFPPITAMLPGAGGIPPTIQDFNGVLFYLSAWVRWQQTGTAVPYDATFQSNIGGYPNGAVVGSTVVPYRKWLSTADNNTSNPDTGG